MQHNFSCIIIYRVPLSVKKEQKMLFIVLAIAIILCLGLLSAEGFVSYYSISIDDSDVLSVTDDNWVCFNIDWWPLSKCDYGYCSWNTNSILNLDLTNELIQNAVSEFAGAARIRLGGSLGDFVVYNTDSSVKAAGYCQYSDFSEPTNETHAGYELFSGCLELTRWDELNAFATRNNLAILFGVNALYGRNLPGPCPEGTNCRFKEAGKSYDPCCTNWTGYWDSSNFESLLRYSADKGYSFYALEFGNELVGSKGIESHISVEDYVHDWTRFVGLIADVYGKNETLTPPKIVVPDTTWMSDWFGDFLTAICGGTDTSLVPNIVTHHLYSLGSGQDTAAVSQKSLNATYLDQIWTLGKEASSVVKASCSYPGTPSPSVWIGEAGGAYNSGAINVTNAFNSGFWYLDQMAIFAATGHGSYCRQTLVGGHYSLLDYVSYVPNPDYYSLLLWSRLMGSKVLATTLSVASDLRTYAHCSKEGEGAITLLFINLSNTTTAMINSVTLKTLDKNVISYGYREEYIFSAAVSSSIEADILQSKSVKLNQKLLVLDGNNIPRLEPQYVDQESQYPVPLVMAPLTYGFVVFPLAKASSC